MHDLDKNGSKDLLIDLYHKHDESVDLISPFKQEIYLFDTVIAGTSHIDNIWELEKLIEVDKRVKFFREADNIYDKKAIKVELETGDKIGYIPKSDNEIFSRLMDAGKLLFGKITHKDRKGNWLKINIKIFLEE